MVYRCVVSIESRRKISAQYAYWLHAYRLHDRIIHTQLITNYNIIIIDSISCRLFNV